MITSLWIRESNDDMKININIQNKNLLVKINKPPSPF